MRRVLLGVVLIVGLYGCTTQPLSQQLRHGYEQADQYALRTELLVDTAKSQYDACERAGTPAERCSTIITKDEAQKRLDLVKNARLALDTTAVALAQCGDAKDCSLAQQKFAAAEALLGQLEMIYLTRGMK